MILLDVTGKCSDPTEPKRRLRDIDMVIFHRIDDGVDAESIAAWFKVNGPQWTGSTRMPYHFVIQPSGLCEQAQPLSVRSPHAAAYNTRSIGIAVIGDFRKAAPTDAQRNACGWLLSRIWDFLGRRTNVAGHTNLPNATTTPGKVCPGEHFPYQDILAMANRDGMLRE